MSYQIKNEWTAGAAIADITPPLAVGLLTSSVREEWASFESLRLPLKARVIVMGFGAEQAVIVALDLIGLTDAAVGGWKAFKQSLSDVISHERIVITCTHTHNAPETISLTDLYTTEAYKDWLKEARQNLAQAIVEAVKNVRPCIITYGTEQLKGFSLQRRIPSDAGVIMSDSIQPIAQTLMDREPVDHRVNVLSFKTPEGEAIATIVHAICHPVHEMCIPQISSDFPGELCNLLDQHPDCGLSLFLNGAAGDINPPTVSMGGTYAFEHGAALADLVHKTATNTSAISSGIFSFVHHALELPTRARYENQHNHIAYINVLRLGHVAVVFLPGEIFVETSLAIEHASPFEKTIVVGFSESSIGYVPTLKVFAEGGYEIGPGKWSFLDDSAERIIKEEVIALLTKLY